MIVINSQAALKAIGTFWSVSGMVTDCKESIGTFVPLLVSLLGCRVIEVFLGTRRPYFRNEDKWCVTWLLGLNKPYVRLVPYGILRLQAI